MDAGSSEHVSEQEDVTVHGIDPATGATTDATLTLRDIDDRRYDLSEDGTYAGADGAAGHTASDQGHDTLTAAASDHLTVSARGTFARPDPDTGAPVSGTFTATATADDSFREAAAGTFSEADVGGTADAHDDEQLAVDQTDAETSAYQETAGGTTTGRTFQHQAALHEAGTEVDGVDHWGSSGSADVTTDTTSTQRTTVCGGTQTQAVRDTTAAEQESGPEGARSSTRRPQRPRPRTPAPAPTRRPSPARRPSRAPRPAARRPTAAPRAAPAYRGEGRKKSTASTIHDAAAPAADAGGTGRLGDERAPAGTDRRAVQVER